MNHDPRLTEAEYLQTDEYSPRKKLAILVGLTAFTWFCILMGLHYAGAF